MGVVMRRDGVVAVAAADAGLGWMNPGFARVPCAA